MSATGRATSRRRFGVGAALVPATLLALSAPAAAHNVQGGSLPTPPWLLAYLGAFLVLGTAVALRATWLTPRFAPAGTAAHDDLDADAPPPIGAGQLAGLALFVLVLVAAFMGPDSAAANIAPLAVFIVWWILLPVACLLLGDVMARINPFVATLAIVRRALPSLRPAGDIEAPAWTSAAFLAAFVWFWVAYHHPGSPRAMAVFLIAYALAAVGLGLRYGPRWLTTGEGFGALSAAMATLSPWRRQARVPRGVTALAIVWVGSTAFDGFTSTPFWADILGTSTGWQRTFFNTVGLVWLTAIVAGIHLGTQRLITRTSPDGDDAQLLDRVGLALIPLAAAWFLAHDITLFLLEGQNFKALLSDPIGRGWDLFGTISDPINFTITLERWVAWLQIGLLAVGHVAAVILGHDLALQHTSARRAMQLTWGLALAAAASIAASALLVLG